MGVGCIPPRALLYYSEPLPTMAPSRPCAKGRGCRGSAGHVNTCRCVPPGQKQGWRPKGFVGTLLCVLVTRAQTLLLRKESWLW